MHSPNRIVWINKSSGVLKCQKFTGNVDKVS